MTLCETVWISLSLLILIMCWFSTRVRRNTESMFTLCSLSYKMQIYNWTLKSVNLMWRKLSIWDSSLLREKYEWILLKLLSLLNELLSYMFKMFKAFWDLLTFTDSLLKKFLSLQALWLFLLIRTFSSIESQLKRRFFKLLKLFFFSHSFLSCLTQTNCSQWS